jgi:hypothetical protein
MDWPRPRDFATHLLITFISQWLLRTPSIQFDLSHASIFHDPHLTTHFKVSIRTPPWAKKMLQSLPFPCQYRPVQTAWQLRTTVLSKAPQRQMISPSFAAEVTTLYRWNILTQNPRNWTASRRSPLIVFTSVPVMSLTASSDLYSHASLFWSLSQPGW